MQEVDGRRRRRGKGGGGFERPIDPRITELRVELAEAGIPRSATGVLPALHFAQHKLGWIPDWAIRAVSLHVRVAESPIYGAGSAYPELRFSEPAARTIRVCTGVPCQINGSAGIVRALEDATGVRLGERDADNRYALEEMACWAVCAVAPVAEIDHQVRGRLTPESVRVLLAEATPDAG